MANKMISDDDLKDDFLKAMIRSDVPLRAPEGFLDGILNRVKPYKALPAIQPYRPPMWLKWGIPGLIASLLIVSLIWSPDKVSASDNAKFTLAKDAFNGLNTWFTGLKINIQIPEFHVSSTLIWIILGGIALSWSFLLLNRFLEKMARTNR